MNTAGTQKQRGSRFKSIVLALMIVLICGQLVYLFCVYSNIPFIKNNLSLILLLGIFAAILGPVLVGLAWKALQKHHAAKKAALENK